jgi:hypothetical protein
VRRRWSGHTASAGHRDLEITMTEPDLAAVPRQRTASPIPQRYRTRWMQRLEEETTQSEDAAVEVESAGVGGGIVFTLGLIWLAATMWTAHASITGNAGNTAVALGSAAAALPGVIAASLLAGATAGLLATGRFAAEPSSAVRRALVGLAAGAVLGLIAAGVILFGYGLSSSIALLAITVGAGSALGGAAAAVPRPVFAASLVATFVVFVVGVIFNVLQPRLTDLFGAGSTVSSQANASQIFAYVQAGVSGVAAGLIAFWFLRRHGSRAWPWYLLAGALPGLLLLLTELLTHLGGASLLGVVKSFSEGDRALVEFTDFARLRNALVVLFVGGLASMIAVGRTLRAAPVEDLD